MRIFLLKGKSVNIVFKNVKLNLEDVLKYHRCSVFIKRITHLKILECYKTLKIGCLLEFMCPEKNDIRKNLLNRYKASKKKR